MLSFNPYFTGLPILIIIYQCINIVSPRFNPYFTGLPILTSGFNEMARLMSCVSILILLDYLFLTPIFRCSRVRFRMFQSLFYWITYSYYSLKGFELKFGAGFNPYFTGLPILIKRNLRRSGMTSMFQSLFYWITYSYIPLEDQKLLTKEVSILILLDYLFLNLLLH